MSLPKYKDLDELKNIDEIEKEIFLLEVKKTLDRN